MILSSTDILRILGGSEIIRLAAKLQITDGSPSLTGEDGLFVYINRFPSLDEFEATWKIWVIDYSGDPIDLVAAEITRLLPRVTIKNDAFGYELETTEFRSENTQSAPRSNSVKPARVDLSQYDERIQNLIDDVNDRMLLVHSGRPGKDGRDGRDGVDGAPGRDMIATDASLEDLQNVEQGINKEKGQVLTWDGLKWTNLFVPQVFGTGSGGLTAEEVREITGLDQSGAVIGHYDRTESRLAFDVATRTFSISPALVGGSYDIWLADSIKRTYTTTESIQIPNTSGGYYIVFNPSGALQVISGAPDWPNHAVTAYVYWNASTQQLVYFADERHGINMDWQVHEYLHRTRGAVIANGFEISNFTVTGTGDLDADAQIDLAGGTFFDEDLQVDVTHSSTPSANTWEQDLQGPARIPVMWRDGASWTLDAATNFPVKAGSVRVSYNLDTAGNWTAADASANHYVNMFVIATNNLNYPVLAVLGQSQHSNISTARDVAFGDLDLSGFFTNEFRPLYNLIFQTGGGYGNSIKARLREVIDLRTTDKSLASSVYTDEQAQDAAAALFEHPNHKGISAVYNDAVNHVVLSVTGLQTPSDPPLAATDPGFAGEVRFDNQHIYVCIADDVWRRSPLSAW